jgi:carbon monoxide dehydrogenase subunit G
MKISGSATLHADIDRVYAALNDPEVLRTVIPGCEYLDETAPDEYRMLVSVGVGSIKGTYKGTVHLADKHAPHSFVLKAAGAGGPGTVSAECKVLLIDTPDGITFVEYDADAVVGGMVAGVGQRMLTGVAKKLAAQFFRSVDSVLTGETPLAARPPGAAVSAGPPAHGAQTTVAGLSGGVVGGPPGEAWGPPQRPQILIGGVAAGALAALSGVVVGWLLGRSGRRR